MSWRRGRRPPRPLGPRNGVPAARVRMPVDGPWPTAAAFLLERSGVDDDPEALLARSGAVLDDGSPVTAQTAYLPGGHIHLHRDVGDEAPVPGDLAILYRDENIVVVDKPHFLATMPRGRHVRQSVVLRLRTELGLPELAPAHRLDRLTAGVLLLTVRPEVRAAYQELFATRQVTKRYSALAPLRSDLGLPLVISSRIVKERGSLQAREVPGEANAITRIESVEPCGPESPGLGRYVLSPETGRTHQLRVHLAALAIPIVNDPLYPEVCEVDPADFSRPLGLVATQLSFVDPISGRTRTFTSARSL